MGRYSESISLFSACEKPWNNYLRTLSKHDATPYTTQKLEAPMYRGMDEGRKGWLMGESVHLHYSKFPDEHLFSSLHRWRTGELAGNISFQQFRCAQPPPLLEKDQLSFAIPEDEVYMKLNYKNPKVFCKYLTRAGTFYSRDVLRLSPEAHNRLQKAVVMAKTLGLFPKYGNPFWHRLQEKKTPANLADYVAEHAKTKQTLEKFCFHWLQTYRIKSYFDRKEKARKESMIVQARPSQRMMDDGYETMNFSSRSKPENRPHDNLLGTEQRDITGDAALSAVPGLMSAAGLRRNPFLYPSDKLQRIGNPKTSRKKPL
ncbi:30S ribosomal protein S18 [Perkinsela sp. CCAP 1560/4]|nr:30S ribosomal protein S18 [Perkinsela sp. CCAP 1560/4]|eukprot:KNH01404.1 30S ribosomal protein S18 [Perkinsela sp. CCAP 1560/4]